jgi:hypothetical protein
MLMTERDIVDRSWIVEFVADEVRLRCSYRRRRRRIVQFSVQLEIRHARRWQPVVRYDNAHGFCHRDMLHADGTREKTPLYYGSASETFTNAIEDVRANWQTYRDRFFRETGA